ETRSRTQMHRNAHKRTESYPQSARNAARGGVFVGQLATLVLRNSQAYVISRFAIATRVANCLFELATLAPLANHPPRGRLRGTTSKPSPASGQFALENARRGRAVSPARVEWVVLEIRSEQAQGGKHATMDSRPGTPRRRDFAPGRLGAAAGVSAQSLVLLPVLLLPA